MRVFGRAGTLFFNGLLLLASVGLLAAHAFVVHDLPSWVYSTAQREFLGRAEHLRIAQLPPTWDVVGGTSVAVSTHMPVQSSHVRATLDARYEGKTGVSATIYDLAFHGTYRLVNPSSLSTTVELFFPFPASLELLHEVRFLVDGEQPPEANYSPQGIHWQETLQARDSHEVVVSYRARGANSFSYGLQYGQRANVDVTVTVRGVQGSTIPDGALAASEHEATGDGEVWTWSYSGLIADRDIRLTLPRRFSVAQRAAALQPRFRVLAAMAPLLVSTFVLALAGVLRLSRFGLSLASYLLIGLGLALFYPLLTFLVGIVPMPIAAGIALLLISSMVLAYLRSASAEPPVMRRALALLVTYLGLFSIGSLTSWRGLALSVGGLLLVGTFMVLWPRSTDQNDDPAELSHTVDTPKADPSPPEPAGPEPDPMCCPYCGRALSNEYQFCPGCGRGTGELRRCVVCGQLQLCPLELDVSYCVCCGAALRQAPASVLDSTTVPTREV